MKVSKEQKEKVSSALRKRPRSAQDLLRISGIHYLDVLRAIAKKETILHKFVWEDGWRIVYWIRPQRMGKVWKRIYSQLQIPASYDIDLFTHLEKIQA